MGTHPIFESDFDCLTDHSEHMNRAGLFRSFLMTGIPLTGYLGYWQYQRWGWKVDLIEKTQTRPLLRTEEPAKTSNLSSRSLGSASSDKTPSIARNKLGACVVTPFELDDGRVILVNRGYVGQDHIPPGRRAHGQATFEHLITGIIRDGEDETTEIEHVPLVEHDEVAYPLLSKRNLKALAEHGNTLPVFIDLDAEAAHPAGPVGGQCKMTFPNNHCAYMIQWWALSLFMTYYMGNYMF